MMRLASVAPRLRVSDLTLMVAPELRRLWAEVSEPIQDSSSWSSLSARVALPIVVICTGRAPTLYASRGLLVCSTYRSNCCHYV